MKRDFSAIIFDLDGVIVDSEPLFAEIEQATCQHFGLAVPLSIWKSNFSIGRTEKEFFQYVVDTYGDGTVTAQQLTDYKKLRYLPTALEELQLFPGMFSFLEKSRAIFPQVALTTSSQSWYQQKIFEKFKLDPFFDLVVTGDQITKGKPDPEPYLVTIQKLQVQAEQCVVIEDAPNGVMSGKSAGCKMVGITHSFSRKELEDAGADYVVDHYDEILPLLL